MSQRAPDDDLLHVRPVTACPCCHGQRFLFCYSEEFPDDPPMRLVCCHCMGSGVVNIEVINGDRA